MLKNMFLRGEVEGWSFNRRTGICYFRQVLTGEQECSVAQEVMVYYGVAASPPPEFLTVAP